MFLFSSYLKSALFASLTVYDVTKVIINIMFWLSLHVGKLYKMEKDFL